MESTNEQQAGFTPLRNRLLCVYLNLGCWGGERVDRSASLEVDEQKKAKQGTATVTKSLVPAESLKAIRSHDKEIRKTHDFLTVSIGKGRSILPAKAVLTYRNKLNSMFDERDRLVEKFVEETYPKLRAKAAQSMGDLYNPEEFPSKEQVRSRFHRDFEVTAMPNHHSLLEMCDIPETERKEFFEDQKRRLDEREESIRKESYEKLIAPIKHLANQCINGVRMHESAVENAQTAIDIARDYNLDDSSEYADMIASISRKLVGVTVSDIRGDKELKKATGHKAMEAVDEIQKAMEGAFGPPSTGTAAAAK